MAQEYRIEKTSVEGRTVYSVEDQDRHHLAYVRTTDHGRRWYCDCGVRACEHVLAVKASRIAPSPQDFDGGTLD